MKIIKLFLVVILLNFNATFAAASVTNVVVPGEPDLKVTCHNLTPVNRFNMCIVTSKTSTNKDVIFEFHQATGGQKDWIKYWKQTRDIWRARGFEPPAVATVNFGPIWFLAEKNKSKFSGLFNFYIETVMPWVEKQLGYKPARKLLLGESMGGFNAAQYYFKMPAFFDKVAIVCPAFANIGPQSTKEEIDAYIERNHADRDNVNWLIRGNKSFFPDAEAWANADVFQLVERMEFKNLGILRPPLLLSCGSEDSWGFFEGSSRMAQILADRQSDKTTWAPISGDHCARPFEAVADFFQY